MFEPVPRFRVILDHFKERILAGSLHPGDALPPVRKIAEDYGVAHATAARAMRELQSEGFAYVVGKTTLVADRGQAEVTVRVPVVGGKRKRRGDTWPPFKPPTPYAPSDPLDVATVVPPVYVNRLLGQADDAEVVRREEISHAGPGRPVRLAVHWFPAYLAGSVPRLLETHPVHGQLASVHGDIDELGRGMEAGLLAFHSRTADEREAAALRIAVGSPVLARVETFGDREGVVEYAEYVYPLGVVVMVEFLDSLASLDDAE